MNVERGIFEHESDDALARSDDRALADIAAGRVIDHAEVVKWLRAWGTPDEGPAPTEWLK